MGPWDRSVGETARRWTVDGGWGGGAGLEVAGGEGCAAVLVLGCMVVGLFPGIAGLLGAGFRTDFVLREFFGSAFRKVLTTNLH